MPYYLDIKNIDLFASGSIFEIELAARYKMKLDNYCKVIRIEAQTMQEMVWQDILPAASAYSKQLSDTAIVKAQLGIDNSFEKDQAAKIKHHYERNGQNAQMLADMTSLPTSIRITTQEHPFSATRCFLRRKRSEQVLTSLKSIRQSSSGRIRPTAISCSACSKSWRREASIGTQ